ncbi:MAG TPA: DUF2628 domain-containing protein [Microvirga sp.]|nr:DUF2628 domain-containing protein [Microvirga sp.]
MTKGISSESAGDTVSHSQPPAVSDALFVSFVRPNSPAYLDTLEKMRAKDPALRRSPLTWCWPAFLVTVPWLLYRKLYLPAAIVALGPLALAIIFPKLAGINMSGVFVVFGMLGKPLYVQSALKRIEKLRKRTMSQEELRSLAERAGGVSVVGAVLGSVFLIGMFALHLASMDL